MFRIILFLMTNLSVMFIFGIILNFTGMQFDNIINLITIAGILGFTGSILSLIFSKWIALISVNGSIIRHPTTCNQYWLFSILSKQSKIMGIKTPKIAIYESTNMNAFATGPTRNNSLIAISSGLLENLNKDEIEAVIGHEINHIANGDMVTMTLLQGIVNTFVIFLSKSIANIITNLYYNDKEQISNENINSFIYFISSTLLELIFGILANIITMWFSRYREFYADAGSAKLVGKYKMISALKKFEISSFPNEPNNIISFCINGKFSSILNLFLSHPPLQERINALYNNYYMK